MKKIISLLCSLSIICLIFCGCTSNNETQNLNIPNDYIQYKNTFLTYKELDSNTLVFGNTYNSDTETTYLSLTTILKDSENNDIDFSNITNTLDYINNIFIPYTLNTSNSCASISYENIGNIQGFDVYLLAKNPKTNYVTTPYIVCIPFQLNDKWYCFSTGTIFQWLNVSQKMEYWDENIKTKEDIFQMVEKELFIE